MRPTSGGSKGRSRAVGFRDAGISRERALFQRGLQAVAGVDEVGRGCWAGPLVAAAVVLPSPTVGLRLSLQGLRDSKLLSAGARERFDREIRRLARGIGLSILPASQIDELGLAAAGRLALETAVRLLPCEPDYLLIDAFRLPGLSCPQDAIIHGDALCLSIAAASVVAKVHRDSLLVELSAEYPEFGFERHKGYGTVEHRRALARYGPTAHHRRSYRPVRAFIGRD